MKDAITMYNPLVQQSDNEKTYLVLFEGVTEEGESYRDYNFIVGSDNVIISIMERIDTLDIFKSQIILQDRHVTLFDRLTLLDFIKHRLNKSAKNPAGNDFVRLGYGDFDLSNYVENSLLLKDISYQTETMVNENINTDTSESVLYKDVEGEDV